jgi:hypothetical protein
MIRVCLSAPFCPQLCHSSRFTCWPEVWIVPGEEYEISRDERKVVRVLAEEGREIGIPEILKAAGFPESRYAYVRKLLAAMVKNDLIHRTQHGKYSATVSAAYAMASEEGEETF